MKKFWHPILYLIFFWQKYYKTYVFNAQEFDKNNPRKSASRELFFIGN